MANIQITDATLEDLGSLSTIFSRAFHKNNEFQRKTFPDTPRIRQWWTDLFTRQINNPDSHVLVAVDHDATDPAKRVLGILLLSLLAPDDHSAGIWSRMTLTQDHDKEHYETMTVPMTEPRVRLMAGRKHYVLELFGVDEGLKGSGLGRKLLQKACDIADSDGVATFVESNMYAEHFYAKFGFVAKERILLPTAVKYEEICCVREAKTKQ